MENQQKAPRESGKEKDPGIRKLAWVLAAVCLLAVLVVVLGTRSQMNKKKLRELIEEPRILFTYMDTLDRRWELEKDAPWRNPAKIVLDHEGLTEGQRNAVYYLCEDGFTDGTSLEDCIYCMDMNGISEEDTRTAIEWCQVDFQAQALRRALKLLEEDAFGPVKLAEQLEDDGFTPEEIDYAVENCGADWAAQTELEARKYLYYLGVSRPMLTRLLVDSGHDPQAVEAVIEKLNPDWNREALQEGLELRENSDDHLLPEYLYQKLLDQDFTEEQSRYAADLLGA